MEFTKTDWALYVICGNALCTITIVISAVRRDLLYCVVCISAYNALEQTGIGLEIYRVFHLNWYNYKRLIIGFKNLPLD